MRMSPPVESELIDLNDIPLDDLLGADDSVLAAAVRRIRDEASSADRSDTVSAFQSAL
jgi:FXSXX-COOH protein